MGVNNERGLWLAQFLEGRTLDYYRTHGSRYEERVLRSIWPVRAKYASRLSSWLFDRSARAEPDLDRRGWPTTCRSWAWSTLGCTVQAYGEWRNRKP